MVPPDSESEKAPAGRVQAEKALKIAEQRYRELFEEAPVMYVITRHQNGVPIIENCNGLFLRTLGYRREQVVDRPLHEFYSPESREKMSGGGYRKALEGCISAEERQLIALDGSVVETLLRVLPVKDSAGNVLGMRAMFLDISARKNAEKEQNRLILKLQDALARVETLSAVSQTVNQSLNLEQVLNDTLDKVMELFKPHSTCIRLLDTKTQELVFAVQKGLSPDEMKLVTQRLKLDNAVANNALQLNEAVAVEDVFNDPRTANRPAFARRIGCHSVVSVILHAKNKTLGNMSIRWRQPHAFTDEEVRLFTAIGNQVGTAIENARLFSQVQRHTEMLGVLNAVSGTVSQTLEIEQLIGDVLEKVIALLHCNAGNIRFLDENRKTLEMVAHRGFSPEQAVKMNIRRKYGEGISWECLESNQVTFTLFNPEDAYQQKINSFGMRIGAACAIHFPITSKGLKLGIMSIYSFSLRAFREDEIELCTHIGRQVGIAIENARLYQQARNTVRELSESQAEREKIIERLQHALAEVKTLGELLPICSHCKNIRDDKGYWKKIEAYIHEHSGTEFSHGICPECAQKYYPDYKLYDK